MNAESGRSSGDLRGRTVAFSVRIIRLAQTLGRSFIGQTIGKQILRSGTNPGAMYREAHRARSDAEFVTKLETALQELDETDYWLEVLVAAKLVPESRLTPLRAECNELIALFTSMVLKRKKR